MNGCLQKCRLHAKTHWKTGSRIEVAVQLMKRAWGALSKPGGLGSSQTVYGPYFLYDNRMASLQALLSCSNSFPSRSQRASLREVSGLVATEERVDRAARERSEADDHAMRLLTSQFFSYLHALLVNSSLYSLDHDRLLEWNTVEMLQCTAPAFIFVFASLSHEIAQAVLIERPAVERQRVIDLGDEGNAVSPPASSGNVGLFLEDWRPLVYRAESSRLGSVHSFSVKTKTSPGSFMKTGRQSKEANGTGFDETCVKLAAESKAKAEDVIYTITGASGAL